MSTNIEIGDTISDGQYTITVQSIGTNAWGTVYCGKQKYRMGMACIRERNVKTIKKNGQENNQGRPGEETEGDIR